MFAPRKGWRRGFEYVGRRVQRLPDTPHKIALGLAAGAFASFTPFFGLHFLLAAVLAIVVRANVMASLLGTFIGNPLTFPFIAASALGLGRWLLGRNHGGSEFAEIAHAFGEAWGGITLTVQSWFGMGPSALDRLTVFFHDLFLPYLVGGVPPGLATAAATYILSRPLIAAYQQRRRIRLMDRAKTKLREHAAMRAGKAAGATKLSGEGKA